MSRIFPNWLEAYRKYADDGFCPSEFHEWTGLSVLAAAIGRKVAMRQGKVFHFPNIYVMLVSHPAVGKSTAMQAGTDLIERLKEEFNPDLKIIPTQCTEPALADIMKTQEFYQLPGMDTFFPHTSGYFYASEASASALQNVYGDFVALMTDFYDCPKKWRKKLKMDRDMTEITNACTNILAGTTFDFLKTIVNERSVMGGFASRLIYVVSKERKIRESKFSDHKELDSETGRALVADLAHIHKLAGAVKPTKEYIAAFEKYQPEFDRYLIDLNSPRMESIMGRKFTHIIKLSILLSVAEGDSLIVDARHFHKAVEMMDAVTKDNSFIVSSAMMAERDSQAGLNQLLLQSLKKAGGKMNGNAFRGIAFKNGNNLDQVKTTIEYAVNSQLICFDGPDLRLLVEPDAYL